MNHTISGTTTSPTESIEAVRVADIHFETDNLILRLNDGRAILLDMRLYPWLQWLLEATPEQRSRWEIVPSGGGVWWTELDEGIELQPLLDMQALRTTQDLLVLDAESR